MYNIIDQSKHVNMSQLLTGTNSTTGGKFDCAKECPCGVPAIPVPDQWLEVMVTGGFKVWHIIFIIIAFVVTIVVVYCCFHRCRIPRTKQEIEADLMRTNLASKFRDYLQEFPNEPTTFIEALKKVQDLEEKSSEQDDIGARKRKGWLKLKGKDKQEKNEATKEGQDKNGLETTVDGKPVGTTDKDETVNPDTSDKAAPVVLEASRKPDENLELEPHLDFIDPLVAGLKPIDFKSLKMSPVASDKGSEVKAATKPLAGDTAIKAKTLLAAGPATQVVKEKKLKSKKEAKLIKTKGEKILDDVEPQGVQVQKDESNHEKVAAAAASKAATSDNKNVTGKDVAKVKRQRDKPNLSRTKATHAGSRNESTDQHQNQPTLPVPSHQQHHHHHKHHEQHNSEKATTSVKDADNKHKQHSPPVPPAPTSTTLTIGKERKQAKTSKLKPSAQRTKTKAPKDSTVIQIEPLAARDP